MFFLNREPSFSSIGHELSSIWDSKVSSFGAQFSLCLSVIMQLGVAGQSHVRRSRVKSALVLIIVVNRRVLLRCENSLDRAISWIVVVCIKENLTEHSRCDVLIPIKRHPSVVGRVVKVMLSARPKRPKLTDTLEKSGFLGLAIQLYQVILSTRSRNSAGAVAHHGDGSWKSAQHNYYDKLRALLSIKTYRDEKAYFIPPTILTYLPVPDFDIRLLPGPIPISESDFIEPR